MTDLINNSKVTYIKDYVTEENTCFDILQKCWEICREKMLDPTQVIFGNLVFSELLEDKKFLMYFKPAEEISLVSTGFVGFMCDLQVLTNYYRRDEEVEWSTEDNAIIFNIGSKISGEL